MTFGEKYTNIKELCKDEISEIEKIILTNINIRNELKDDIVNFLKLPSKRIRPVLSILFLKASCIEITEKEISVLAAVELVHNASLIHHDIIDNSNFRRGEETLSYKFGNKLGVICGDYLLAQSMDIISKLNSNPILELFTETLKQMCIGEINQHFDRYKIGTIEEYIEKTKQKTGCLFRTAIKAPLLLSKCENINTACEFGINFGIAFQIKDDLMNITSSSKNSDKPVKNDIDDGIYTAPVIYAQSPDNYINGVEKTVCLLNNYIEFAKENINNLEDNIYKRALNNLLELLKYEKY